MAFSKILLTLSFVKFPNDYCLGLVVFAWFIMAGCKNTPGYHTISSLDTRGITCSWDHVIPPKWQKLNEKNL